MRMARLLTAVAFSGFLVVGSWLAPTQHSLGHAAQAAAGPVRGGTVIDGLYAEPDRLIPATNGSTAAYLPMMTLFSPLFLSDQNGVTHPALASGIPTVANGGISKDGLSYTFRMRPGLTWSDGMPLDARDVDYSWRLWTNPKFVVNSTIGFNDIKSATVSPDHLSITFHLMRPFAPFLAVWTDIVMPLPMHIFAKSTPQALNTSHFTFFPTVSSGPFMMVARKAGDTITEVRNPHFYLAGQGLPYLDKLIFRTIPNSVALTNALASHEIDSAWNLDPGQITTLKQISGYTFAAPTVPNIEEALVNLKNPILADVRVRQALEYGLDRPSMIKAVWKGYAAPMASDEAPDLWSWTPTVKPYPYDAAKAGQLLDAAGWKMGTDGYRHRNGKLLSLRWSTTSGIAWRQLGELIAQQDYRKIGIQLRIVNYPSDTFFGSIMPSGAVSGKWDLGEEFNTSGPDPDTIVAPNFQSNQVPPNGADWGWYVNPAYDKLIAQEEGTTDVAQRKAIFARMQAIMNHDLPALWLYSQPEPSLHVNTLHNYEPAPYSVSTWNAWEWWKG